MIKTLHKHIDDFILMLCFLLACGYGIVKLHDLKIQDEEERRIEDEELREAAEEERKKREEEEKEV